MSDWKADRVGSAERGENPMVVARMKSGFAVIGDTQLLPGYCVLLAYPKVKDLRALPWQRRSRFLLDMSLIGDAIQTACNPARINYSIYGNTEQFLHAHVFPWYEWEPAERQPYPVWQHPAEMWRDAQHAYSDTAHRSLREKISAALRSRTLALTTQA